MQSIKRSVSEAGGGWDPGDAPERKRRVSNLKFPSELSSEQRRWLARFSKETTNEYKKRVYMLATCPKENCMQLCSVCIFHVVDTPPPHFTCRLRLI